MDAIIDVVLTKERVGHTAGGVPECDASDTQAEDEPLDSLMLYFEATVLSIEYNHTDKAHADLNTITQYKWVHVGRDVRLYVLRVPMYDNTNLFVRKARKPPFLIRKIHQFLYPNAERLRQSIGVRPQDGGKLAGIVPRCGTTGQPSSIVDQ